MDLTFISENEGWALGVANCLSGPGRCTAIYRTMDGKNWTSVPGAEFNVPGVTVGCDTKCVTNIRFANEQIGYAYGPSALFMTTDGGANWTQAPGYGAVALETFDNNVIRVVARGGAPCGDAGCEVHVETAPIGSSTWTTVALPGSTGTRGNVQLARTGSAAYLLITRQPVEGGNDESSMLFTSTDDGAHWTRHTGDPCPQVDNTEVDSTALAAAQGGVSVVCKPRFGNHPAFVAVSTNGGATFTATPGTLPGGTLLTGDPGTVLVAATGSAATPTVRSVDGGTSWQTIPQLSGRDGGVSFIGFESETTGRAITDHGTRIWTTSDAGKSWQDVEFPT